MNWRGIPRWGASLYGKPKMESGEIVKEGRGKTATYKKNRTSRQNRDLRRTKKLSMEKQELNFWELAIGLLLGLLACALITMFAGCTTVRTVETVRTDTVWQNHTVHDSIHVKDSVWVERWTRGDTVYVVKDRWKTEWRERLKTDTVYIAKHDTVRVEAASQHTDDDLSWWQKEKMRVGALVIFLMAVAVVWAIYKVSRKILP